MLSSQAVAPYLPYLRRYARALTGSQDNGDAFVRAALRALVSKEARLDESLPPRHGLYKLFHGIWSAAAEGQRNWQGDGELQSPDQRLMALSARPRAVLLLTAVEGFSLAETGAIIGAHPSEVEASVLEAQRAIERDLACRVLIIEDEPIIALDLESLVTELNHTVVASAATRDQAVRAALAHKPGLILADINLGEGGSGIDAVNDILSSFEVPVIFITAYPEKLLTGERPEPTYLIAKPFLPETVQATVGQALFFHPPRRRAA